MTIVCFYDMAPGALTKVPVHFPAHRARVDDFRARGELIAAGPLGDPPEGAMALFPTAAAAEAFVRGDPFVVAGLVAHWRLVTWSATL